MEVVIGAVIGALVTGVIGYLTWRFNCKQLYAQTVSGSRNIWLTQMREYIAKMLANSQYDGANKKPVCAERQIEYFENRNQILLRLNDKEAYHIALRKLIYQLDDNKTDENIHKSIIEISQLMLKEEWEKVKREAKGEK